MKTCRRSYTGKVWPLYRRGVLLQACHFSQKYQIKFALIWYFCFIILKIISHNFCYNFCYNLRIWDPFRLNLFLLKLKTENWKHYSKIIFKYVNSIVGPIFNIFKYVNSVVTMREQYYYSMWIVIFVSE